MEDNRKIRIVLAVVAVAVATTLGFVWFLSYRTLTNRANGPIRNLGGQTMGFVAQSDTASQAYMERMIQDYEKWVSQSGFVRLTPADLTELKGQNWDLFSWRGTFRASADQISDRQFGTWRLQHKDGTEIWVQPHLVTTMPGPGPTGITGTPNIVMPVYYAAAYPKVGTFADWLAEVLHRESGRKKRFEAEIKKFHDEGYQWAQEYFRTHPVNFHTIGPWKK